MTRGLEAIRDAQALASEALGAPFVVRRQLLERACERLEDDALEPLSWFQRLRARVARWLSE